MISYFGTSQDRNTQKWPLSLSSSRFFLFCIMLILHMLPPILLEAAICCLEKTRLCDQRGCTAGACGSEWCTENLQILWWWATSRGTTVLGMRGLATSCTKQTKKKRSSRLKTWSEVCVCVFLMVCVLVFFDFPSSIDKCWLRREDQNPLLFLLPYWWRLPDTISYCPEIAEVLKTNH